MPLNQTHFLSERKTCPNGFPVRCTSACTNTQKMDALLLDKPASPHEFQTKKNG